MSTLHIESDRARAPERPQDEPYSHPDDIRIAFTIAMSAMYKSEVPLYGDLVRIVSAVNQGVISGTEACERSFIDPPARLDIERHGAIRLGTPYELRTISRLFRIMGLRAVDYYDLSAAGLPMHATCFRPTEQDSLRKNPFRVFTTLLRPELLEDEGTQRLSSDLLSRRHIFSTELLRLIDLAEKQNGRLLVSQAAEFVGEALKTFAWKPVASATEEEYAKLASEHPILADIASFNSSHINHLTPRTLDIGVSQQQMKLEGMKVKDRIEGPPSRKCPILLRQTSFLALEETIKFRNANGALIEGTHEARFGEIEERGAAVTPAGRKLFDELLSEAMDNLQLSGPMSNDGSLDKSLLDVFKAYPDDWSELRRNGLVYFTYRVADRSKMNSLPSDASLDDLVGSGAVEAMPITYEDFLPFSAAGIFQSNLGSSPSGQNGVRTARGPDQEGFEAALGCKLLSSDDLYLHLQTQSIDKLMRDIGA